MGAVLEPESSVGCADHEAQDQVDGEGGPKPQRGVCGNCGGLWRADALSCSGRAHDGTSHWLLDSAPVGQRLAQIPCHIASWLHRRPHRECCGGRRLHPGAPACGVDAPIPFKKRRGERRTRSHADTPAQRLPPCSAQPEGSGPNLRVVRLYYRHLLGCAIKRAPRSRVAPPAAGHVSPGGRTKCGQPPARPH